jgi:glycosyltransferase involved in cell wall biosynthesis
MLCAIETHPIQYHAPVYRSVQQQFGIPVTAIYGSDFSVAGYLDREFGKEFAWDTDLLSGYSPVFLSRVANGGAKTDRQANTRGLGAVLRKLKPKVVLLCGYSPRFYRSAFLRVCREGHPLLFRGETTDHAVARPIWKQLARDWALRFVYGRCARLLFVGQRSQAHFKRLGFDRERLVFSPYCVDTGGFVLDEVAREKLRGRARQEMGIGEAEVVLLFSGKLSFRKGPDLLVKAVRTLPETLRRRCVVVFLGDGELRNELAESAKRQIEARVHFAGFRNQGELSPIYHAADLLVLPSRFGETWGLVANEALHHAVPCVVSDAVGCAPDLIEPGITGETFETGSVSSLVSALERAMCLIDRSDVRAACRRKVSAYTLEKASEGIAHAYSAIVGRAQ